ncbi:M23 family metallopeptidase [Streptomyces sp. KR80]|uniref:M23 family metallopeptidase n=1 Tax=Streptomyces sp. KR80 TaxID=3457426 RepID=UPI003FD1A3B0
MSARGRHRRHQPNRISQASLTVTAGGAGMALPLVGVSGATAAPADTWDEAVGSGGVALTREGVGPRAASAGAARADTPATGTERPATERQERAKPESYTVVSGDTLFTIARVRDVDGGWERLYEDNREVIGGDPDLILPGQRLALGPRTKPPGKPGAATSPKETRAPRTAHKPRTKPQRVAQPAPHAAEFTAPVSGVGPSTPYRASGSSWSSGYHTGVDFSVPTGTSVRAVAGGRVVSAGWGGAYGYQVVIRHSDGKYSQYAHLSALTVRPGQPVGGGQRIGRSGSTGNTTGPHLHFEVRTGPDYGSDINPLGYLRDNGVGI